MLLRVVTALTLVATLSIGLARSDSAPPQRAILVEAAGGIYTVRADGTGFHRLAGGVGRATAPAWSRDGRLIAFVGSRVPKGTSDDLEIYQMNADGSHVRRMTHNNVADLFPAWSPDRGRIAFVHGGKLAVMDSDGSHLRTTRFSADRPAWSPDGRLIVFGTYRGAQHPICVVNADGTHLRVLTTMPDAMEPAWSPDGKRIAFSATAGGPDQIFLMDPRGKLVVQLTKVASAARQAAWSATGDRLVFVVSAGDRNMLATIGANGRGEHTILSTGDYGYPSW